MNEIEPISILVPNQVLHVEWPIFSGDTKFQHSLKNGTTFVDFANKSVLNRVLVVLVAAW